MVSKAGIYVSNMYPGNLGLWYTYTDTNHATPQGPFYQNHRLIQSENTLGTLGTQ